MSASTRPRESWSRCCSPRRRIATCPSRQRVRSRAAPGASAGSGGLLRGRGLRIGDGLGRGHRPCHVVARSRPPGARAVQRACLSVAGGRGTDASALADAAGHPRRRQAGQLDPHHRWAGEACRFRHLLGPQRAPPPLRHPRLPGAGAGIRRRSVARQRRLRTRGHGVRAVDGSAPSGVLPPWEGIDPAQAQQLEAAIRLGMATNPARRPATPGSWSSGCARAGRRRCPRA